MITTLLTIWLVMNGSIITGSSVAAQIDQEQGRPTAMHTLSVADQAQIDSALGRTAQK